MDDIKSLMIELDGADPETVDRIAYEKGSLPVRLAMLGLATIGKGERSLWWGYPPGVFISYKWDGELTRGLATDLAEHVRGLGYRAFLDVENLDTDADAYFEIPQFISSLMDCNFYVLLLTRHSADLIFARDRRTTWIHDEFQQAVRLVDSGRLIMVPVLLEREGLAGSFTPDLVIDMTAEPRTFEALEDILAPNPLTLDDATTDELMSTVSRFDVLFLRERWEESAEVLQRADQLCSTFDHRFRQVLHALYTADQRKFTPALDSLHAEYGAQIVANIYEGYCRRHTIPNMRW